MRLPQKRFSSVSTIFFSSETGLPSSDKEEGQPKVFDAGSFSYPTISFFLFVILIFFSDEEEELAEAEQEDGQDVQEDVGEAEAAEEEGEVREVAQEDQEAGPLKRSIPTRRL